MRGASATLAASLSAGNGPRSLQQSVVVAAELDELLRQASKEPKIGSTQIGFTQNWFYPESVLPKIGFTQNWFCPKSVFTQNRFLPKIGFAQNRFCPKSGLPKIGFTPN